MIVMADEKLFGKCPMCGKISSLDATIKKLCDTCKTRYAPPTSWYEEDHSDLFSEENEMS
jgi:NMD protein affecting ribosome stability and mRNA decay